jgi:hypothetical protein
MPARATLNGTITATGGENCDVRGFDWGTESGVYPNYWTENGSFGTGSFNHLIEGLDLDKTYYFRCKAHNYAGWGYSSETSFSTALPTTVHFYVPIVRDMGIISVVLKQLRNSVLIALRKSHIPFEPQQPVKGV